MQQSNIYLPLWQKYKPAILINMRKAIESVQYYQLTKHEFEVFGDRGLSGFCFNLEIKNGKINNNIEGSAVARDLFEVLNSSRTAKELMLKNSFKISLTSDFKLIVKLNNEQ